MQGFTSFREITNEEAVLTFQNVARFMSDALPADFIDWSALLAPIIQFGQCSFDSFVRAAWPLLPSSEWPALFCVCDQTWAFDDDAKYVFLHTLFLKYHIVFHLLKSKQAPIMPPGIKVAFSIIPARESAYHSQFYGKMYCEPQDLDFCLGQLTLWGCKCALRKKYLLTDDDRKAVEPGYFPLGNFACRPELNFS